YFYDLSKRLKYNEIIVLVGLSKKQIKKLPENIIGINRTDHIKELAQIYTAADVFVNPTLEDNFPTTNLESMACGTPIITFNTGGSIESVDKDNGFIIMQGNQEELYEKIQMIKKQGKQAYFEEAIKKAKREYRDSNKFQEYIT